MTYIPPNPNGQATMANSTPVVIASDQSAVPVSGTVAVTGVATAANQATIIGHVDGIETAIASTNTKLDTVITHVDTVEALIGTTNTTLTTIDSRVDGLETNTASTNTKLDTLITQTDTVESLLTSIEGDTSAIQTAVQILDNAIAGNEMQTDVLTLPITYAAGNSDASTQRVVIANNQQRINVQLDALQVATTGTITTAASIVTMTDLAGIGGVTVQISGTYAGVNMTFEASVDGTNFVTIPAQPVLTATPTPVTATGVITANSTLVWNVSPLLGIQQFRVRSTAYTSGTANILIEPSAQFTQYITSVSTMPTTTVTGTVTSTVTGATLASGTVAAATQAIPLPVADVVSAALTTTTTTAAFTPTAGMGYQLFIPVTAVSGTTPTLIIAIEESMDSGTTWFTRTTLPVITATGSYYSPYLKLKGNRVRYVQTVAGTTPSFTRAISRLQGQSDIGEGTPGKLVSAATTNATLVKAGPTTIQSLTASNVNAAARYLKIYDLSVAPTVGTSIPVHTFIIPGNTAGAGSNVPLGKDIALTRGFAFALTTEATDAGTTAVAASEIVINYSTS